jgi:hypothetical protein
MAALKAKQAGNTETAVQYMKIYKVLLYLTYVFIFVFSFHEIFPNFIGSLGLILKSYQNLMKLVMNKYLL